MRIDDPQALVGRTVIASDGEKIGKVQDVYFDMGTDHPEWISVTTGLFGTHSSLVPLAEASEEGDDVRVPYGKEQVKAAPHHDPGQQLSEQDEADIFRYYGTRDEGSVSAERPERGTQGRDLSGPTTDEAMTRSEERLHVGSERVERGRARLRKYIVSEHVQTTVPVSREEVRIEREPITDANREAAMSGPELSEEEHEVMLTEERPVVSKEAIPVERVRLGKERISEEQQVTEQIRKEQIETDDQTGKASQSR
jgi:uncharacterized protein (TIGR02271 family)